MSSCFATGARRLCGIAARLLGWRPDDFWKATPAELAMALDSPAQTGLPPSPSEIQRMMERDNG